MAYFLYEVTLNPEGETFEVLASTNQEAFSIALEKIKEDELYPYGIILKKGKQVRTPFS